jgi:hypothetical protein
VSRVLENTREQRKTGAHSSGTSRPAASSQSLPRINPTKLPVNPAQFPVNPAQPPVNPAQFPVNPAQPPVNPAKLPVNPPQFPVNPPGSPLSPANLPLSPAKLPTAGRLPTGELRDLLPGRVRAATALAWESQDAELAAEQAALEADPGYGPPDSLAELAADPDCGPPDGPWAWLADLPGELIDEFAEATAEPDGPEVLKAGFWDRSRGDGGGFASGGIGDTLAPGPVLAGLVNDLSNNGLDQLGDDELIGVLIAARKLCSWSAALELAAVSDLRRRREDEARLTGDSKIAEHVLEEVAAALTLTVRSADCLLDLAASLAALPGTFAALQAGLIDRQKAYVIADETAALTAAHRAAVEQHVLGNAPGQTSGQLRAATRRGVIAADPAAARKRRERAQRDARVERWEEPGGTGALAGRDLPPTGVLAADHNVSALARALKAAGAAGTMDQLRARAFLMLLTGESVESVLAPRTPSSATNSGTTEHPDLAERSRATSTATATNPHSSAARSTANATGTAGATRSSGAGGGGLAGLAGTINLTMPLATWLGLSDAPGEASGYGPMDSYDSRDLASVLATHPLTRWCITVTDSNGQTLAHGCARKGTAAPPSSSPGKPPGTGPPRGTGPLPRSSLTARVSAWLAGITLAWLETGDCTHERESSAYRPPPSLQHLLRVRQQTCGHPGCRRPAKQCDLDHSIPFEKGGRTCECNLAPAWLS